MQSALTATNWQEFLSATALAAKASDIRELLKLTARPDVISFAGGLPDPTLFPIAEYEKSANNILEKYGSQALQYSVTEGQVELRTELVRRLEEDGIKCEHGVENLLITTGSQQALDLITKTFIDPGDVVLVEAPSYLGALQAFSQQRPEFHAILQDKDGLIIERLAEKLAELKAVGKKPKFLYTVPNFQNPSGVCMSAERRHALIKLSQEEDLIIIEDDPYGKLRFRGDHLPSLKSLDRTGRVLSLRTFSKTLTPGLRTGYVIGDPLILRRLAILKQASDLCTPALSQYIILDMLERGMMEAYTHQVIEVYRAKEETMVAALKEHCSEVARWNEPDGGMFLWVELTREGADCEKTLPKALAEGVAYVNGTAFYTDNGISGHNFLRLSFSQPLEEKIVLGVERLGKILNS
jgi:2-aminoadipate transaminase